MARCILCLTIETIFSSFADLSDVVIRKDVDMGDFLRRYDLTPLVQAEKLDAGKRVLQRVSSISRRCLCISCSHREMAQLAVRCWVQHRLFTERCSGAETAKCD
jgi:hypothetical protein